MAKARHRARPLPTFAALTVLALTVTACAGSNDPDEAAAEGCEPAGEPVTLQYWHWVPGMDEVVAVWNEQNPDIQVEVTTVDDYPTISNALTAGQAPELAQIEYSRLSNFRAQDAFIDASACIEAIAPDAGEEFLDWTWSQATFGGEGVFAIPQDIGPLAMYYNTTLFDRYGIEVPTTWEEFAEAAKEFAEADPTVRIGYFDASSAGFFNGMLWQNSASLYSYADDGWSVTIDNPESRQVAEFWQGLIDQDLVRTDLVNFSTPLYQAYQDEQLAVYISAAWGYSGIRDNVPGQSGQWAVAELPQWDASDPAGANWGGSTVAFLQGNEYPYESTQFLLWLNNDPDAVAMTYELGGLFPASVSGLEIDALQEGVEFYGGQQIFDIFSTAAGLVDVDFMWGPTQQETDAALQDAMARAVTGSGTLTDALAAAQDTAIATMQEQSIPVVTD